MNTLETILANLQPDEVLKELVLGDDEKGYEHIGFYVNSPGLMAEQTEEIRTYIIVERTKKMKQAIDRQIAAIAAAAYDETYKDALKGEDPERAAATGAAAATAKTLELEPARLQAYAETDTFSADATAAAQFRTWVDPK